MSMHPMISQRCSTAARRLLATAALVFSLQLIAPSRAAAVQLFIENAFVHAKNPNCIVEVFNGVPRFRCPPYGFSTACTGVTVRACPPPGNVGGDDCTNQ